MSTTSIASWTIVALSVILKEVNAHICTKEVNGYTQKFQCPQPLDSPNKVYCCGTESFRYCCDSDDYNNAINQIGLVIGILVSIVVAIVIIVILSCFCCSCCLLARRRQHRGRVLSGPSSTTTTTVAYPTQQPAYPQQPYPQQPYPTQYPPPAAAYPPYPPVGNPPPYGVSDQPAYNPQFPMPK